VCILSVQPLGIKRSLMSAKPFRPSKDICVTCPFTWTTPDELPRRTAPWNKVFLMIVGDWQVTFALLFTKSIVRQGNEIVQRWFMHTMGGKAQTVAAKKLPAAQGI
jgi:hypothetical protein